jgi:hypothetical protein
VGAHARRAAAELRNVTRQRHAQQSFDALCAEHQINTYGLPEGSADAK